MVTIHDIFRAALNEELKNKWGGQTALANETGFSLSKIHSLTTGARKSDEETTRLVAEKLGYPGRRYEDFLDVGRRALGLTVSRKGNPPSPEVADYLTKARKALEGPKAHMVKDLLNLIEPD